MSIRSLFGGALLCVFSFTALAEGKWPWEEYEARLKASHSVAALKDDLFGDNVSLANGALSFSATDIELPGNSTAARVAFGRKYSVFNRYMYGDTGSVLTDWEMDIPNISAVFAPDWVMADSARPYARCSSGSNFRNPPGGDYFRRDFWHGTTLSIPGTGGGTMLKTGAHLIAGVDHPWRTADDIRLTCLPTIKNSSATDNEGFLAVAPDGTKYWFDHMAQYVEPTLIVPFRRAVGGEWDTNPVQRRKNVLYVTKVQDRFGNTVIYNYANEPWQPAKLLSIVADDGRRIDFSYENGRLKHADAQGRRWQYGYVKTTSNVWTLTNVVLPDQTNWEYQFAELTDGYIKYGANSSREPARGCLDNGTPTNFLEERTGVVKHPVGARGTFRIAIREHGRSNVPIVCNGYLRQGAQPNDRSDDTNQYVISYHGLTLIKKSIAGPGIAARTWDYSYEPNISYFFPPGVTFNNPTCTSNSVACGQPICVSEAPCAFGSRTTVASTDGSWQRYRFGNSYLYNEGKLLAVESGSGPDNILRTETHRYDLSQDDTSYPAAWGTSGQGDGEGFVAEFHRPLLQTIITEQGVQFSTHHTTFDARARALTTVESSTVTHSPTRTRRRAFFDDTTLWVLGQLSGEWLSSPTVAEVQTSSATYDARAQLHQSWRFGQLQATHSYHPDGTLASMSDGRDTPSFDTTVTLSDWYRGVPRRVDFPGTPDQPSGTSQLATVDTWGAVTSVTGQTGATTTYGYDLASRRLTSVTYPTGDTTAWNGTQLALVKPATAIYGLPVGYWKHTTATGNAVKATYLDAMWRPVVEESYDAASPSTTRSLVVKRYDASGQLAFQSYPVRSLTNWMDPGLTGVSSEYDAIGRPVASRQHSELGTLTTTTEYLSNYLQRVTNPRGQSTVTFFHAFGEPTLDMPSGVVHPEGAVTEIHRDTFGDIAGIYRRNGDASVGVYRTYTYDAQRRVCKTVEPETGATLMRYDVAGNLAWSAAGQTDSAGCGTLTHADRKSDRTYDQRGRLKTLRFTDTRGDQDWSYTPDGLPLSVVTVNRVGAVHPINQYVYNKRRMLVSETQHLPAWYSYSTAYSYDANGSLSRIHYPSTDYVDFAPNALGQATRARNSAGHDYAANVTYHPNGSIAGFTYGNGIVHAMTRNARQLPLQVTNTGVISDSYSYDANGNVTGIVDAATSGNRTKSMTYDGLDRLLTAHSPVFGGDGYARYTYDVLDNLRTVKTATRDHTYWYDAKNQLTGVIDTATNGTVTGLAYDRSGNVQQKNGQAYDFDYGNRLREVLDVERYRYDAYGRRILAMNFTQGTITSLYSNAGQLLFQRNERVGEMKDIDHVYLAGSLIAQKETPVGGGTATIKYQHTDALGTPVVVTGSGQAVIDRVDYEPYGKALTPGNSTGKDRPGFTGHVEDRATSLTYMQQRYQDPELGLFLSSDPVTALSDPGKQFNRFRYANSSPYVFADPDGRRACGKDWDCRMAQQNGQPAYNSAQVSRIARNPGAAIAKFNSTANTQKSEVQSARYFADTAGLVTKATGREVAADIVSLGGDNHTVLNYVLGSEGSVPVFAAHNGPGVRAAVAHTHPGLRSFSGRPAVYWNGTYGGFNGTGDMERAWAASEARGVGVNYYVVGINRGIQKFDMRSMWSDIAANRNAYLEADNYISTIR